MVIVQSADTVITLVFLVLHTTTSTEAGKQNDDNEKESQNNKEREVGAEGLVVHVALSTRVTSS
jgi:hypothetical protein